MAKRYLVIFVIAMGCVLVIFKPAVVKLESGTRLLVLLRWQSGEIQFVNSVTEKPVSIHFQIRGRFQNFTVKTDETTEAYYTNGLYPMNEAVSRESTNTLNFCSMKGISLTLGFYDFSLKDGCLEVKLLWTI
ncbi:MAG TPA: hypothetical protein VLP30_01095 [Desulfatirhabdiaceae bacterium]|nr:hypothetical protein [Desulfatirhabdiaceae bacterium]